jgi:hypothetical protein
MLITWSTIKNNILKQQRNVCFEDVEQQIIDNKFIILNHFNLTQYPNQDIILVSSQ